MQYTLYLYHRKRSMVPIYICLLTHVLILKISVVNTCVETIDRFRLSNNVYNKQYVCLLQAMSYVLKLNSTKPFNNIIHIEFYGLSLYQHLSHCNVIQDVSLTHSS